MVLMAHFLARAESSTLYILIRETRIRLAHWAQIDFAMKIRDYHKLRLESCNFNFQKSKQKQKIMYIRHKNRKYSPKGHETSSQNVPRWLKGQKKANILCYLT